MILISYLLIGLLGFCCFSMFKSQNAIIKDIVEEMIDLEDEVYEIKKFLKDSLKDE